MSWIPTTSLVPLEGRFARAALVQAHDPQRPVVEAFIAQVYRDRHGAQLRSFLPHLLAYRDSQGQLLAAVGMRLGQEGPLFVEQYLDLPAERLLAERQLAGNLQRRDLAEVGSFAASSPGAARELILQLTCTLHAAHVRWVLFAATRQLRNAFGRLNLSLIDLAAARADRLQGDASDWGRYYDAQPRVMCGDVGSGYAHIMRRRARTAGEAASAPGGLCLAVPL
jgi:hypothetical protein